MVAYSLESFHDGRSKTYSLVDFQTDSLAQCEFHAMRVLQHDFDLQKRDEYII